MTNHDPHDLLNHLSDAIQSKEQEVTDLKTDLEGYSWRLQKAQRENNNLRENYESQIAELTDRAETSEEYIRELSPALVKANNRAEKAEGKIEFWMNRAESDEAQADYWKKSYQQEYRRAEKAEARVKDADWKLKKSEMRVKTAEDRLKEVGSDRWELLNRAEAAEVYRDVNRKRAEKAEASEARVKELVDELNSVRSLNEEIAKHLTEDQMSQILEALGWDSFA